MEAFESYLILGLIAVVLLVVVFVVSRTLRGGQWRTSRDLRNLLRRVDALEKYQERGIEHLDKKFAVYKEKLNEMLAIVKNNNNEFVQKMKKNESSIKGLIHNNSRELEKLTKEIYNFSREIEKMKDVIRERTIDMEL